MGSAGKKLRTRMDIGKDIQSCLDDLNNMTHAKLAELLNLSEKTVDRMVAGKGPITKYASDLAKITGKPESWFKENITWEESGKREVTSVHFKAENVSDQENEIVGRLLAYIEKIYNIPDENLRNKMMERAEKNLEGDMTLIELMGGKLS